MLFEFCRCLKGRAWITQMWALWRGRQQESLIRREWQEYKRRAEQQGFPDELDEATLRDRLRQRLASRGAVPKRKGAVHILYATPLGNWEKHNIPPALQRFGRLTPFYLREQGFDDKAPDWLETRHRLDQRLLGFVEQVHARQPVDVLVSYLSGWHVSAETIQAINRMGIVTCAFWWDDRLSFRGPMKGRRYTGAAPLAAAYDLNLTNASDSIVKYLAEGGLAMFWPEAADPEHFRPLGLAFEYDVSFVGGCYGYRPTLIDSLRRKGIRIEAFGPGWPNGPVSEKDMVEIYARSRINMGFGGIGYSMREQCLKGRDFEVPMCGALYLTSEHLDLHRVFEVGREIVTYTNKEDCLAKVRYFLANPQAAAAIRQAARARCLRDHTWEKRFEDVFQMAGLRAGQIK